MGVSTEHIVHAFSGSIFKGSLRHPLGDPKPDLIPLFDESAHALLLPVKTLDEPIGAVQRRRERLALDEEFIVLVPVEDDAPLAAPREGKVGMRLDAERLEELLGEEVMVSGDPDDPFSGKGDFPESCEQLPMVGGKESEVRIIENVAV